MDTGIHDKIHNDMEHGTPEHGTQGAGRPELPHSYAWSGGGLPLLYGGPGARLPGPRVCILLAPWLHGPSGNQVEGSVERVEIRSSLHWLHFPP